MNFRTFLEESNTSKEMQEKIALLMYMAENDEMINESYDMSNLTESQKEVLLEDIKSWFHKIGLDFEKGDGIIDYISQFTVGTGKLILAAIKGDKKKVKEIADGLTRGKVIDFLFKLDILTLHIITEPIHIIDAITGWELMADIKRAAEGAVDQIKIFYDSIKKVKDTITNLLNGKKKEKMSKYANNLEHSIPKK